MKLKEVVLLSETRLYKCISNHYAQYDIELYGLFFGLVNNDL